MGLITLPNGQVVDAPDNITPEGLRRLKSENAPRRRVAVAKDEPKPRSTLDKVTGVVRGVGDYLNGTADAATSVAIPFVDRIAAGVGAAGRTAYEGFRNPNAPLKEAFHKGGETYDRLLAEQRGRADKFENDNPVSSGVASVAGALMNPIGEGTMALRGAAKLPVVGKYAGKSAEFLTKAAKEGKYVIPRAALVGGNQGAVLAASGSEDVSDMPFNAMLGYGVGAPLGAGLGAAAGLVSKTGQRIKDSRATSENAARLAYERVAELLQSGKITPDEAVGRIAAANKAGTDMRLMDMTPGLQSEAGVISRKPSVSRSNELIETGEHRIEQRPRDFEKKVRDSIKPPTGQDALARAEAIKAEQKATGKETDEAYDQPLTWNDDLHDWVSKAGPTVRSTFEDAANLMRDERMDPSELSYLIHRTPVEHPRTGHFTQKPEDLGLRPSPAQAAAVQVSSETARMPSMRTMDYVKRAVDDKIGALLKAGDKNKARVLSSEVKALRAKLAAENPAYGDALAKHRDLFEQTEALELGEGALTRTVNEPRVLLKELKGLDPEKAHDARTGFVEALLNLPNKKADPVLALRQMMRTPNQRKVMEFVFQGKGNLAKFEKWMKAQKQASRTDALTAPGRQSETARFGMADEDAGGELGRVATSTVTGGAYGGPVGAMAGAWRGLNEMGRRATQSPATREEIARLLLGKGEDIRPGIAAAKKFRSMRKQGNQARVHGVARVGGFGAASVVGD
jgi:hypothetical protein